jgi:hypothetical protein
MFNLSPFDMYEILSKDGLPQAEPSVLPELAHNDNSEEGIAIREYRAELVSRYSHDWVSFFLDWKKSSDLALSDLKAQNVKIQAQNAGLAEQNRSLYEETRHLRETNKTLLTKIDFLVSDAQKRQEAQASREAARERRRNAKSLPLRDVVFPPEFERLLEIAAQRYAKAEYNGARVKLS